MCRPLAVRATRTDRLRRQLGRGRDRRRPARSAIRSHVALGGCRRRRADPRGLDVEPLRRGGSRISLDTAAGRQRRATTRPGTTTPATGRRISRTSRRCSRAEGRGESRPRSFSAPRSHRGPFSAPPGSCALGDHVGPRAELAQVDRVRAAHRAGSAASTAHTRGKSVRRVNPSEHWELGVRGRTCSSSAHRNPPWASSSDCASRVSPPPGLSPAKSAGAVARVPSDRRSGRSDAGSLTSGRARIVSNPAVTVHVVARQPLIQPVPAIHGERRCATRGCAMREDLNVPGSG